MWAALGDGGDTVDGAVGMETARVKESAEQVLRLRVGVDRDMTLPPSRNPGLCHLCLLALIREDPS